MAENTNQAAASSGYWENLRRQRRREIEERAQIAQEGKKNLVLGRISAALGLGPDIAEVTTPPLVTPSASIKTKTMKPFPAGMTKGEMPPKDGKGLEYKYTSADFAKKFGISQAELIAGDVVGPGAPVSAATGLAKGAAAAVKGLNLSDLAAASSALVTGIFAGKRARNLPKLSYDRALEMEKAGDGKYRIYEETGFWKGPEGDWRFEINDKDIKFKPEALKSFEEIMQQELLIGAPGEVERLKRVRYAPITDVVEHPELFEAYPELKEYYIKVDPEGEYRGGGFGGMAAGYQQGRGETVPLPDGTDGTRPVIMLMAPTRESEIRRLKDLLPQRESLLKGQQDELNNILDSTSDEYKALLKDVTNNEKALAGMMERLQALEAGGQPDIPFSVKSTLTHELQHAVQDIENFPRGGSPAAAEMQTEIAIKQIAEQTGKSLTEIKQAVASRNYTIAKIAALDKILYLQFLQRYINSDNPTRSARLINNSSLNYEITAGERDWLGPPPSRRNIQKYGAYLRRKAELYQAKVIDNIIKREESGEGYYNVIQDALGTVMQYERKRGKVDLSNIKTSIYEPKTIGNPKFYQDRNIANRPLANPDEIIQPNWMAIPENVLKNAIKRLSKEADQYVGEQKVLRKIEDATKELEKVKRDNPFDYQTELYYRLAGEAEARAVQKRFEMATEGVESDRIPTAMKDYGGAYDRDPEQLAFYYPRDQVPTVPAAAAVNVPKSDVGFTSPALRVIMESNREQLPKEQWLKFLKGNGVKDDELEFSGLGEWLKQQKGQVSRADLEEYMTTQNQLKIEEVVYGGNRLDYDVLVADYVKQMEADYHIYQMEDAPEQFADELAEGANPKNFVIEDPNGEVMYNMGGDIMTYGDRQGAEADLEFLLERSANQMPEEELLMQLGIKDESADFFGPVKYGSEDLSLPGQRDEYRELVLYWDKPGQPSLGKGYSVIENPTGSGKYSIVDDTGFVSTGPKYDSEQDAINAMHTFHGGKPDTETLWYGSHQYTDKPNPLLHIRFSERRDSAGERILVIEEIQSDIAKRGQKEGFRPKGFVETNEKIKALELELQQNSKQIEELREYAAFTQNQQNQYDDLIARGMDLSNQIETEKLKMIELPQGTKKSSEKRPGAPEMFLVQTPQKYENRDLFYGMTAQEAENNAKYFIKSVQEKGLDRGPFIMDTKDYMELGLKRMILWASENGFEKIAWTTGEQQMKRYNQLVEGIQELTVQFREDKYRILGTGVNQESMDSGYITRNQLDDYVGERVAQNIDEKLSKAEPEIEGGLTKVVEVPVDDLKLPKDPRHFLMIAYDKVLKNAAQKLGKKYDAKVEVGEIGAPYDDIYKVRETEEGYAVINTEKDEILEQFTDLESAQESAAGFNQGLRSLEALDDVYQKVWTLNLSEKLKSAAEKGLPYMAVVPPAAMMMNQEQDRTPINRAAARPIMENYAN